MIRAIEPQSIWRASALCLALMVALTGGVAKAQHRDFGPPYLISSGFSLPAGLAINATNDRLLITDAGDHRVRSADISDLAGEPEWQEFGYIADASLPEALHGPQAVAVDAAGNAYVVDTFGNEVQLYRRDPASGAYTHDPDFARDTRNSVAGIGISLPRDIAVAPDGTIYLLDSGNNRLLAANGPDDASWEVWRHDPTWGNPYGLDVAGDGTVFLADTDNNRIWRLAASGTGPDAAFGHYGTGNGQFDAPRDVAVASDGRLFVADTNNHRVVVLNPNGSHYRTLGAAPLFDTPQKVAVDGQNSVFVVDPGAGGLVAYFGAGTAPPFDLFLRDFAADSGAEPSATGVPLSSPDVLVRHQPDVNLSAAATLGLESYPFQQPNYNLNNYVYLAVRNRGTHPIAGGLARLYWADPASPLVFPTDWHSDGFYQSYTEDALWTHHFGTPGHDVASAIDSDLGGLYVAGYTSRALPGQASAGNEDGYLRKLDVAGRVLWTRQFGTPSQERVFTVAVDPTGAYAGGVTRGVLAARGLGNADAFVRKYDLDGNELWTRQFGTHGTDELTALIADATGLYVAGYVELSLPGQTSAGNHDVFVRKYDADGNEIWTRQFGTGRIDEATALTVDGSGVYVAGHTAGELPGQTEQGDRDAFVRKYDQDGNEVWTLQFGSDGEDRAQSVASDGVVVHVGGVTTGRIVDRIGPPAGGDDAFLFSLRASDGEEMSSDQFGTTQDDAALAVVVGPAGPAVAGYTQGQLTGQPSSQAAGGLMAFIRQYAANGEVWTCQYGATGFDSADAMIADSTDVYLAGRTSGIFGEPPQVDAYVRRLDSRRGKDSCLALNTPDNALPIPLVMPQAQRVRWTRQFGSPQDDDLRALALDGSNVYTAGTTEAFSDGSRFFGRALARKYDSTGSELWSRNFGAGDSTGLLAAAANGSGLYVAGVTDGALPNQTRSGGTYDGFLRKYDEDGAELWTRQFGNSGWVRVWAIGLRGDEVYLAGESVGGSLPGAAVTGDGEGFLRRYDAAGDTVWTRQFSSTDGDLVLQGLAVDATGVYVGGTTFGSLPGFQNLGASDGFVRKYNADGNELWARQFGTQSREEVTALAADNTGLYAVGFTDGTWPGQVQAGEGYDGFVRKFDPDGNVLWTRQFGSDRNDLVHQVTADDAGIYVTGFTTGALPGQAPAGDYDGFVRWFDRDGNGVWAYQFGTSARDEARAVASDGSALFVAGATHGTLPGQVPQGGADAFVVALRPATLGDNSVVLGPLVWRPPAPERTIAADGQVHVFARLAHPYDPSQAAQGLDQVRRSNNVALQTATIPGDTDNDGIYDGEDNCRLFANADQADLDQDGEGDVCDSNIDGDACINRYDPKPADISDPDEEACLARPLDPALTRGGRLVRTLDPRLDDPRLQALLDGILPGETPGCGPLDCPPPTVRIFDANLRELLLELREQDYDLAKGSGFGATGEWLPDLNADGLPELAVGAPFAAPDPNLPGAGVVLIVSGRTGEELGRIAGRRKGSGFGTALARMDGRMLAVGAPGTAESSGVVYLIDLTNLEFARNYSAGEAGDQFGSALAATSDLDGDGAPELAVGAPAARGRGAVYAALSRGSMRPIGTGSEKGDAFGHALLATGDVSGDRVPEILIGAPGASLPGAGGVLRARPLKSAGSVVLLDLKGAVIWTKSGKEPGERFGTALAAAEVDRESNIVTEVLVGAPGWQSRTGRAYLMDTSGRTNAILSGTTRGAAFGASVAVGPDIDGNGAKSLVLAQSDLRPRSTFAQSVFYDR